MDEEAPVKVNDVIADKYRVDRVLGAGGMGVVVSATHLDLGQPVALKFLLDELAHREELVARFLREARNCVSINSEHVVRVMDVGRLPSGAPYMVMEYLEGHDLEGELQAKGPLPVRRAADLALQTCVGLAEAHSRQLVHRDLKPANLFLTTRSDGENIVKILDFGISKSLDAGNTDGALTRTNQSMGTPFYMSPEQVRAAPDIDFRTDIWSLGAIIYETLWSRPPFDAHTASAVCAQVLEASPQPLPHVRPDVPEQLWQVIAWCLRKDRANRPQNVAELAAALVPYASPHGVALAERVARVLGVSPPRQTVIPQDLPPSASLLQPPMAASGGLAGMTDTSFATTGWPGQEHNEKKRWLGAAAALFGVFAVGGIVAASLFSSAPEDEGNLPSAANGGGGQAIIEAPPPPPVTPEPPPVVTKVEPAAEVASAEPEEPATPEAAQEPAPPPKEPPRKTTYRRPVRPVSPPPEPVKVRPEAPPATPRRSKELDPLDGL